MVKEPVRMDFFVQTRVLSQGEVHTNIWYIPDTRIAYWNVAFFRRGRVSEEKLYNASDEAANDRDFALPPLRYFDNQEV